MADTQKPLLFGENTIGVEQLRKMRESRQRWDASYIPGYGEKRVENDERRRKGQKPVKLPRFYWVRDRATDGTSVDYSQRVNTQQLGYAAATVDVLKDYNCDVPPTGHVQDNGMIRREDTVLAFTPPDVAEENRRHQNEVNERERAKRKKEGDGVQELGYWRGRDPVEFEARRDTIKGTVQGVERMPDPRTE